MGSRPPAQVLEPLLHSSNSRLFQSVTLDYRYLFGPTRPTPDTPSPNRRRPHSAQGGPFRSGQQATGHLDTVGTHRADAGQTPKGSYRVSGLNASLITPAFHALYLMQAKLKDASLKLADLPWPE